MSQGFFKKMCENVLYITYYIWEMNNAHMLIGSSNTSSRK